jgi:hypothetical protein
MNVFTKANQMINIIYQSNIELYRKQSKKMSGMTSSEKKEYNKNNYVYKKEPYQDNLRYIEM